MAEHRAEQAPIHRRIGSPDSLAGAWFLIGTVAVIIAGLVTWLGASG